MLTIEQFVKTPEIITQYNYLEGALKVQRIKSPKIEVPPHYHKQHLLIIYETPGAIVQRYQGSKHSELLFTTGNVSFHPAGEYGHVTSVNIAVNELLENILVHIDDTAVSRFCSENLGISKLLLKDCFYLEDPLIADISRVLLQPFADNNIASLYKDSLCETLYCHLISNYASVPSFNKPEELGLTNQIISQIDEYIYSNLSQSIRLDTLAGIACLSVFHFTRMFKKTTGYSPYQYVLKKKIIAAKKLIRQPGVCAAEVGYKLGFSSPGHFNSFFKKHYGVSPGQFRKK